ncbi:MAG: hypothetical protein KBD25_00400 [Rickettsiaceae bacterium]|nr:hypothetical protein [Rickettsiaceae bacterium]
MKKIKPLLIHGFITILSILTITVLITFFVNIYMPTVDKSTLSTTNDHSYIKYETNFAENDNKKHYFVDSVIAAVVGSTLPGEESGTNNTNPITSFYFWLCVAVIYLIFIYIKVYWEETASILYNYLRNNKNP